MHCNDVELYVLSFRIIYVLKEAMFYVLIFGIIYVLLAGEVIYIKLSNNLCTIG